MPVAPFATTASQESVAETQLVFHRRFDHAQVVVAGEFSPQTSPAAHAELQSKPLQHIYSRTVPRAIHVGILPDGGEFDMDPTRCPRGTDWLWSGVSALYGLRGLLHQFFELLGALPSTNRGLHCTRICARCGAPNRLVQDVAREHGAIPTAVDPDVEHDGTDMHPE
jgi:hypothetical protein